MGPIIVLEELALQSLIAALTNTERPAHKLRVAIDESGVKFKINEGMWSPPLGKLQEEY